MITISCISTAPILNPLNQSLPASLAHVHGNLFPPRCDVSINPQLNTSFEETSRAPVFMERQRRRLLKVISISNVLEWRCSKSPARVTKWRDCAHLRLALMFIYQAPLILIVKCEQIHSFRSTYGLANKTGEGGTFRQRFVLDDSRVTCRKRAFSCQLFRHHFRVPSSVSRGFLLLFYATLSLST